MYLLVAAVRVAAVADPAVRPVIRLVVGRHVIRLPASGSFFVTGDVFRCNCRSFSTFLEESSYSRRSVFQCSLSSRKTNNIFTVDDLKCWGFFVFFFQI